MKKLLLSLLIVLLLCVNAQAADVTLQWDANTESDLGGYRIYYGSAPRVYAQPKGSGIDVGKVTTYIISGLPKSVTYFAVTAYDTEPMKNESDYSNEVWTNFSPTPPANMRIKVIVEVTVP